MSKILRVVGEGEERLTFVAGGPVCCFVYGFELGQKAICRSGRLKILVVKANLTRYEYEDRGECPACHGTGLMPVERWSDARKAEWLNRVLDTNLTIIGCSYRDRHYGFEIYHEDKGAIKPICKLIGFGNTLTEALTAAVIAVAEVE